jgi:hypothetical protein
MGAALRERRLATRCGEQSVRLSTERLAWFPIRIREAQARDAVRVTASTKSRATTVRTTLDAGNDRRRVASWGPPAPVCRTLCAHLASRAPALCANCEQVKWTRLSGDRTPRACSLAPHFNGDRDRTRYRAQYGHERWIHREARHGADGPTDDQAAGDTCEHRQRDLPKPMPRQWRSGRAR